MLYNWWMQSGCAHWGESCTILTTAEYHIIDKMTEYLELLDPKAKKRYLKRLYMLGLSKEDDLLVKNEKFSICMTAWPNIEYGQ